MTRKLFRTPDPPFLHVWGWAGRETTPCLEMLVFRSRETRLSSPDLPYTRNDAGQPLPSSEVLHDTVVDLSEHLQILPLTKQNVRLHKKPEKENVRMSSEIAKENVSFKPITDDTIAFLVKKKVNEW